MPIAKFTFCRIELPAIIVILRSMPSFLDFGKPIIEFEGKIEKLHYLSDGSVFNIADKVTRMIETARINDFDA